MPGIASAWHRPHPPLVLLNTYVVAVHKRVCGEKFSTALFMNVRAHVTTHTRTRDSFQLERLGAFKQTRERSGRHTAEPLFTNARTKQSPRDSLFFAKTLTSTPLEGERDTHQHHHRVIDVNLRYLWKNNQEIISSANFLFIFTVCA